ncbi:MAG: hypothetical protein FWD57_13140, partial [Polyangiaceae bacterium]|nr:hypothetical protein [Polyangiaceae bacterium]
MNEFVTQNPEVADLHFNALIMNVSRAAFYAAKVAGLKIADDDDTFVEVVEGILWKAQIDPFVRDQSADILTRIAHLCDIVGSVTLDTAGKKLGNEVARQAMGAFFGLSIKQAEANGLLGAPGKGVAAAAWPAIVTQLLAHPPMVPQMLLIGYGTCPGTGVLCPMDQMCGSGECVPKTTASPPPDAPSFSAVGPTQIGVFTPVNVHAPGKSTWDGWPVQVECWAEDSDLGQADPWRTTWLDDARDLSVGFTWKSSGTKGIWCRQVDMKGASSKWATTTIQVTPKVQPPTVDSVTPLIATVGDKVEFVVKGSNLSGDMKLYVTECKGESKSGILPLDGSSSERRATCVPQTVGSQPFTVYTTTQGTVSIAHGNVQFYTPVATPKITGFEPTTAKVAESTTFRVYGEHLPESLQVSIPDCTTSTKTLGVDKERIITCTPKYSGVRKVEIMLGPAQPPFVTRSVEFVDGASPSPKPTVSSLSPLTAKLGTKTLFTVTGNHLPSTTRLHIPRCTEATETGTTGSDKNRTLWCTPQGEEGTVEAVVKDDAGGANLAKFNVTFYTPVPVNPGTGV